MSYSSKNHWTIFKKHHEATRAKEKAAWKIILKTRKKSRSEDTPIVIWGFEASPSIWKGCELDITGGCNKEDYIHRNYFFSKKSQDKKSYRYMLIKRHINMGLVLPSGDFSRDDFICELSNSTSFLTQFTSDENTLREMPIHLVYDIFSEWHGLDVTDRMRESATENMEQKAEELKRILEELELQKNPIHFIWCASGYANLCNNKGRKTAKCTEYFIRLKACFGEERELHLYHKPYGFFKYDRIEEWSDKLKCFKSCGCSCRKKPV